MRRLWRAGLTEHPHGDAFWLYLQEDTGEGKRAVIREGDTGQVICDKMKEVSLDLVSDVVGAMGGAFSRDGRISIGRLRTRARDIALELHRHCFRNQLRHFHVCGALSVEDARQVLDEHYVEDVMEA